VGTTCLLRWKGNVLSNKIRAATGLEREEMLVVTEPGVNMERKREDDEAAVFNAEARQTRGKRHQKMQLSSCPADLEVTHNSCHKMTGGELN